MADSGSRAPQRKYILGLDIGTTTVKAALVDAESGKVVKCVSRPTKASIPSDYGPGGHEQDVQKILTALQFCVSGLPKEDQLKVQSIGVSGQMHGVLFWKYGEAWHQNAFGRFDSHNSNSQKTSHLFTWEDERSSPEFLACLPKPSSHLRISSGYGCATIFWMCRNKAPFLKNFDCAGTIQDFVVTMLCNLDRPLMSVQNAASWGYFDTETNSWNKQILDLAGFPVSLLPDVCEAGRVAGKLQSPWYSIPTDTPVMVALGDMQCSIFSNLYNDDDAVLNLSTSAQLSFPLKSGFHPPPMDPLSPVEYFPYFDGRYVAVAASLNGGNIMAAFVSMLQQWTHEFGYGVPEEKIWERLSTLGAECPTTNLVISPTIHGERHKPDQSASVSCIMSANLSLSSVYRALCKGIVGNLYDMMPADFLKSHGVKRIVGTGTAITKNQVIKEEVEKMFSLPIFYGQSSDASVGVALATRQALHVDNNSDKHNTI